MYSLSHTLYVGGYYGPAPAGVTLSPIDISNPSRVARNFDCTGVYGNCTWSPSMAGATCPNGNAILNCVHGK